MSDGVEHTPDTHERDLAGEQAGLNYLQDTILDLVDYHAHEVNRYNIALADAVNNGEYTKEDVGPQLDALFSQVESRFRNLTEEVVTATRNSIQALGVFRRELEDQVEEMKRNNTAISSAITRLHDIKDTVGVRAREAPEKPAESAPQSLEVQAELEAKQKEIDALKAALVLAESRPGAEEVEEWKKSSEHFEESLKLQEEITQQQEEQFLAVQEDMRRLFASRYRAMVEELAAVKGNIRVICRIKPENAPEEDRITFTNADPDPQPFLPWSKLRATYQNDSKRSEDRDFQFQRVFGNCEGNEAIFDEVKDIAKSAIFGQACTVMAYGATGTGKSHTFLSDDGLVQRYIGLLFDFAEEEGPQYEYEFRLSAIEIYLNKIYDLLKETEGDKKAEVRLNTESTERLESQHGAAVILKQAIDRREAASTKQNDTSSRSHFVVSIRIQKTPTGNTNEKPTSGVIHFIDLAGSEAAGKNFSAGASAHQALLYEQGQDINLSLLDLGQGVRNLATKGKFFPGHNLTRALRSSLTPGSRLLLVATVSSLVVNQSNTMNTLKWSQEAIGIRGESGGRKTPPKTPETTPPRNKPAALTSRSVTPTKRGSPLRQQRSSPSKGKK